jgi:hypothetical protein
MSIYPNQIVPIGSFKPVDCRGRRLGNAEKCACKTTGKSFVQTRFGLWLLMSMGFMLILFFSSMI